MKQFTILIPIFLISFSEIKSESEKIVGGDLISISDAPYQAALLHNSNFICGASIFSTRYLLTAAHCVHENRDKLSIRIGSSYANKGGELLTVEKAIKHPNFNFNTLNNDFAILKLFGEIKLQPGVKEIIKLPSQNDQIDSMTELYYVTGYGMYKTNVNNDQKLRGVLVPIVAQNICRKSYPILITNQMFCAGYKEGGKDSCSGDSGGPLVRRTENSNTLIGVVSFGYGCAQPNFYGVYARVSSVRKWIRDSTNV